jgi:hypothetical protein
MRVKKYSEFFLKEAIYHTPMKILAKDEKGNPVHIPAGAEIEATGMAKGIVYFEYEGKKLSVPKKDFEIVLGTKKELALQENADPNEIADEIEYEYDFTYREQEGDDVRLDKGDSSIWLRSDGIVDGDASLLTGKLKKILRERGFSCADK